MLTEVIVLSIVLLFLIKPTINAVKSLKQTVGGWIEDYKDHKKNKQEEKSSEEKDNL